jgi:hypothetical protein
MRRFATGILVTLAALAVVAQLVLPRYLAGRVEDRLEQGGGSAKVSLGAFPALTLLSGRGGSIEIQGRGLSVDLDDRRVEPLKRLDGFSQVHINLEQVSAGPLALRSFDLDRDRRDAPYELRVDATTTPRELAAELGSEAGGTLGGLVGSLATGLLPNGGRIAVPLELTATIRSDGGRADVVQATGSVAGVPAGSLTEIVVSAVLDRL